MANTTYKIILQGSVNGVTVTPTDIAWISGNDSCLTKPCYKEGEYLVVEILPDCVGNACIEGYLLFGDNCTTCDPIHFKKCFCATSADCDDCEECNELGVCQSTCLTDQFCVNDNCVDCDETHPCTGGRICINGTCTCPQGTFWNGTKCVECDNTTVLTACEKCINGVITPVNCAGACDPIKGCVDCVNDTHCANRTDGKHCCDGTNHCICCPGYIWDPIKQTCVVDPCPPEGAAPCKRCTEDGWVDVICPDNYKCDPEIDDCVYSPCGDKPCDNGLDCATVTCGCPDDTKICTDCLENPNGRGCEPNNCENVTCSLDECGEGCGCYEGTCIPCSWLTEEEQAITPGCNNKACKDTFDVKINGCNLETSLITDQPCACPVLMGALNNGAYTNISTTNVIKVRSNFTYELRKGLATDYNGFTSLPLLTDISNALIAHNETPTTGVYTLELIGTYKSETAIGVFGPATTTTIASVSASIANASSVTFSNVDIVLAEKLLARTNGFRDLYKFLTNLKVVVKYNNLVFPNGCNYGSTTIFEKTYSATALNVSSDNFANLYNTNLSVDKYQTAGTRNPLFIYKRSKSSNFTNSDIIRKVYVPKINGLHKDILYGPGCVTDPGKYPLVSPEFGFYSGYNYLVTNDCGCGSNKSKLVTNAVVCENITPVVTLSECNTKLQVDPIQPNCAVNKDLSQLLIGCTYPLDAQVYYKLYVNDVFQANLLPQDVGAYIKTFPTGVNKVKITHIHDESCVIFEQTYESAQKDPTYTIDCKLGNYADIVFPQVVAPGVTIVKATNTSNYNEYTASSGTVKVINVGKGSTVTIKLEFSDGCLQYLDIPVDCCDALVLSASMNNNGKICNSNPVTITLTATNGYGYLEYYINGALLASNTYTATQIGIYEAKVIDENGCEEIINVTVGACTDIVITNNPTLICTGQNSNLRVEGDPGATVVLQYPNLSTTSFVLDSNGVWEQTVSADGDYEILTYNGVTLTGVTSTLDVVTTPTVTAITAAATACEDTSVPFTFTGTAGASITVNFGFGSPVNLVIGNGGTVNYSIVYPNSGTFSVDVTSVSVAGSCAVDPGISHSITILQKPNITIGNTVCDLIAGTASTAVTITPSVAGLTIVSGTGTISGLSGNYFIETDTSETLIIRATNGSCTTDVTIIVNCNCPEIAVGASNPGTICASYNTGTSSYDYSVIDDLTVNTTYLGTFTGTATYNGNDYPMSSNTGSVWLSTLPLDYDLLNPDLLITIEDTVTGCISTYTLTPNITVTPVVTISGPTTLCEGSLNTFTSNTSGSAIGFDYEWTVLKNGSPFAVTGNTSSTFSFTPTTVGAVYEVTLTRTHTNGCATTSAVYSTLAATCCSIINIGTTGTIGSCSTIQLTATGGTAPYTWSWTPTGTLTETQSSLSNNIINTTNEAPGATGTYEIEVEDANGCTKTLIYSFTKCACLCDGAMCKSDYNNNSGLNGQGVILTTGEYQAGKILEITTRANTYFTSLTDRFKVYVHNGMTSTLIFDSGYPYLTNDGGCPVTNGYTLVDMNPYANGSNVSAALPTCLVTATLTNRLLSEIKFTYTTAAGDWIEIVHNDTLCNLQAGYGYRVKCLN